MIKFIHNSLQFYFCDTCQVPFFGNVLLDHAIYVFISSSFPGWVGMSKKNRPWVQWKIAGGHQTPCRYLQRWYVTNPPKVLEDEWSPRQPIWPFTALLWRAKPDRLSLCQSYDCMATAFTQNCVSLPISKAFTLVNHLWLLINTYPVRQLASSIIAAIEFTAFLLNAPMFIQFTSQLAYPSKWMCRPSHGWSEYL